MKQFKKGKIYSLVDLRRKQGINIIGKFLGIFHIPNNYYEFEISNGTVLCFLEFELPKTLKIASLKETQRYIEEQI